MSKSSSSQMGFGDSRDTAEARIRQLCFPLALRIKNGHIKLWERWQMIRAMKEGPGKDKPLNVWDEAKVKLYGLEGELEEAGYCWCLYTAPGDLPKFACLVCPMKPFLIESCPAWGVEILIGAEEVRGKQAASL